MGTQRPLSWLVALAGVWEIIAAFLFGYSAFTVAFWNAIVVGALFIILGAWAALSSQTMADRALDWINAILGIWLIIAPFVLGYATLTAAMWNDIIVGAIVVILAAWAALTVGHQRPMVG